MGRALVILMLATAAPTAARAEPACPQVDVKDVRLPAPVQVDEIRVVVDRHSPVAGAAAIRVDDGRFDRIVRVSGTISKNLRFDPVLVSSAFQVTLDPVFDAPRGACVARVELVHGGVTVATVVP
jgi:hypothetical protein